MFLVLTEGEENGYFLVVVVLWVNPGSPGFRATIRKGFEDVTHISQDQKVSQLKEVKELCK